MRDRDAREAVRMLSGLRERQADTESEREPGTAVQKFRSVTDTTVSSDSMSATTQAAASATWDSDDWGLTEWQ